MCTCPDKSPDKFLCIYFKLCVFLRASIFGFYILSFLAYLIKWLKTIFCFPYIIVFTFSIESLPSVYKRVKKIYSVYKCKNIVLSDLILHLSFLFTFLQIPKKIAFCLLSLIWFLSFPPTPTASRLLFPPLQKTAFIKIANIA